jgi:hypothetical protein
VVSIADDDRRQALDDGRRGGLDRDAEGRRQRPMKNTRAPGKATQTLAQPRVQTEGH